MNRRNLIVGALATVASIAAVAVIGEVTGKYHIVPQPPQPTPTPIALPPIEPEPPDATNDEAKPKPIDHVVAPVGEDIPRPIPPAGSFTQPVEPPQPITDFHDVRVIPLDRRGVGPGDKLYNLSDLDRPPIPTYQARPNYPSSMRQEGSSGRVLVEFTVDPRGGVRNAVAVESTRREFEDSACAAVAKWKFRPGWKNGHAVYARMQVPIVFTLDQAR